LSESKSEMFLFDVSPEERDGQKKKKASRKKKAEEAHVFVPVQSAPAEPVYGFMAAVDGHYECDKCGATRLDLVEIRKVDGQVKWMITCGWWCMHRWLVDPIAGLLDEQDKEDSKKESFRVRGGRFDGKTFDEIDTSGNGWYIDQLIESGKRSFLAEAAAKWKAAKKG